MLILIDMDRWDQDLYKTTIYSIIGTFLKSVGISNNPTWYNMCSLNQKAMWYYFYRIPQLSCSATSSTPPLWFTYSFLNFLYLPSYSLSLSGVQQLCPCKCTLCGLTLKISDKRLLTSIADSNCAVARIAGHVNIYVYKLFLVTRKIWYRIQQG